MNTEFIFTSFNAAIIVFQLIFILRESFLIQEYIVKYSMVVVCSDESTRQDTRVIYKVSKGLWVIIEFHGPVGFP